MYTLLNTDRVYVSIFEQSFQLTLAVMCANSEAVVSEAYIMFMSFKNVLNFIFLNMNL